MTLREFRKKYGVSTKAAVDVIRGIYPKFDKTCLSKAESDQYGVGLPPDALSALYAAFAPEMLKSLSQPQIPMKRDYHQLTHRISARLTSEQYGLLQQAIESDGYTTFQSWLTDVVSRYLEVHNGKNP